MGATVLEHYKGAGIVYIGEIGQHFFSAFSCFSHIDLRFN